MTVPLLKTPSPPKRLMPTRPTTPTGSGSSLAWRRVAAVILVHLKTLDSVHRSGWLIHGSEALLVGLCQGSVSRRGKAGAARRPRPFLDHASP